MSVLAINPVDTLRAKLNNIFDDPKNPRRLANRDQGSPIGPDILDAKNLYEALSNGNNNDSSLAALGDAVKLAEALNMFSDYFTDASMNNIKTVPDPNSLATINNTLNNLGISNEAYKSNLNDLIQQLANANQGRIEASQSASM